MKRKILLGILLVGLILFGSDVALAGTSYYDWQNGETITNTRLNGPWNGSGALSVLTTYSFQTLATGYHNSSNSFSNYDAITYTIPATGHYRVSALAWTGSITSTSTVMLINNSTQIAYSNQGAADRYRTHTLFYRGDFTSGDVVKLRASVSGGSEAFIYGNDTQQGCTSLLVERLY